jgi:asparagine synthase (glutamine-hydrolysing)
VVALARQRQKGKLNTYSIAFVENEWNEGKFAQKVATEFDTNHIEYQVTASLAQKLFPQFLSKIDQPSIDGFNTFCVSQIAYQDGMKVVLSGLGGDELFGGYQTFQQIPSMVRWGQKLQKIPGISTNLGKRLAAWGKSPKMKRLGDFLQQKPTATAAYHSFRGIFSHREAWQITQHYIKDLSPQNIISLPFFHGVLLEEMSSLEDEVSWLEMSCYLRNQLLRDSDVMSMAWGLELRVPLVDKVLLETISSIPSAVRLARNKQLLTQAIPELPSWVINRPKRGFFFPFQKWINQEWSDYFPAHELSQEIDLQLWYRRWNLAILDFWWQQITA